MSSRACWEMELVRSDGAKKYQDTVCATCMCATCDDDEPFPIERIVRADKVGGWYRLWIKWKDHTEITPRWKSELVRETSNPELLEEIERAG